MDLACFLSLPRFCRCLTSEFARRLRYPKFSSAGKTLNSPSSRALADPEPCPSPAGVGEHASGLDDLWLASPSCSNGTDFPCRSRSLNESPNGSNNGDSSP